MHKVVFLLRGMWGLGHVTPSAAIAKELDAHSVRTYFLTYAHGVRFLKANGFRNVYDIGEPNHPSGIVQWKDMFEVNRDILPLIKRIKPEVVVVDGECDALFLLGEVGAKVVFLTTPPYLDLDYGPWKRYREYGRSGLKLPDKIIVHGFIRPKSHEFRHVFVGAMSSRMRYTKKKGKVVPIILGTTSSSKMKAYGRDCAEVLTDLGYEPIVVDNSAHDGKYIKDQLGLFERAPLIVTHGGLSTLEEAAVLGIPTIVLHDNENEEKSRNAKIAQRLKFGVSVDITKPFSGRRFVEAVKKASMLGSKFIRQKNGLDIAVNAIESML